MPDRPDVRIAGPFARKLMRVGVPSEDVFLWALVAGDVAPGVTLANALSRDVHEMYRIWCRRLDADCAPMPRFIHALQQRHKVRQMRVRYRVDGKSQGPHGVLMLGGHVEPLDAQIARFHAYVLAYQGAENA